MTAIQPPHAITTLTDGTPAQHPTALFRRLTELLAGGQTGVRAAGDLAVTANGTPNMSVNVAAGEALIPGTQQPASQGSYYAFNDGPVNLAIAASNATNPRRDLVVARVYDRDYAGTIGEWRLEVVTGTPAVSPVDPATPADSLVLARVAVAAGVSSISAGNITDLRSRLLAPQTPDQLYPGSVVDGQSTSLVTYLTQNAILVAPYDLTMIVDVLATEGANAAANLVTHTVLDETGTKINHGTNNFGEALVNHATNTRHTVAFRGRKDYTAGQTCGFRLQYKVSGSNIFIDASARVSFVRR